MAACPLRRAICAGAKKGAAVALRTILPRYVLPLPSFRYKRDLGACYGCVRAILYVLFCYAALLYLLVCFTAFLHCARLVAVLRRRVKRRVLPRE